MCEHLFATSCHHILRFIYNCLNYTGRMKTTTPTKSDITKALYEAGRLSGKRFFAVYDDFLELSVNAFCRDDNAYMEIMKRYGPRIKGQEHPADYYAKALAAWMAAMQHEPRDYLGEIYEDESITNKYDGQFFTPEPLCDLMATITIGDELQDNQIYSDPSGCGSGRTLIAGIKRNRYARFVGVDKDRTCVNMTALNCLVRNVNAYVIHADGLTLETYGGYRLTRSFAGGSIQKLTIEQAHQFLTAPLKQETIQKAVQTVEQDFDANERGQYDLGF
jgi:hypothetical protein